MAKTGGGRNHLPLPPALLAEILSRLPAKDLLRFKCVHKQWANLINSRDFIKLHVKRTASSRKNRTLVISNDSLYSVNLKTNQTIELEGFPLKSSIIPDSSYPDLFATCDGLLCYMLRVPHSDLKSDIIIWNMTTKEYRKVRVVCRSAVLGYYEVYGFGYDSMRDDYKLVRIIQFPNVIKKVEVYSLRHKSWSTVTAACPHFLLAAGRDASVAHVNGSLYWIMSTERSVTAATARTLVIAFNLSTEDYTEVETPHMPYLGKERIFKLFVVGLEGKLCLVYNSKYRVDTWLMAEYGKKRSWYKFLSLDEPLDVRNYQLVPLAISAESNSRILLHWSGLVGLWGRYCWYDIKKHKARIRVVDELQSEERCQWEICLSSLVKLDAKGYSKVPKSGNWKEEKNKRRVERDGNEENSSQSNGGLQIPRVRIFRGHPSRKKEAAWCLELGSLVRLPNSLEELKNIAGEKLGFDTTDLMVIDDAGGIIDSIEVIRDNDTLFMVNEELRRRSFSHYFILLISILFLFVATAWCNASLWKRWSGNE